MKKQSTKTFKCKICKNIFPIYQMMLTKRMIFDARKYFHGLFPLCKRCYQIKWNAYQIIMNEEKKNGI